MYYTLFIYSIPAGHHDCIHTLAMLNKAAENIREQAFVWT